MDREAEVNYFETVAVGHILKCGGSDADSDRTRVERGRKRIEDSWSATPMN